MDRMILHSDINACYASIELLRHPELRHGIILAKDQMARAAGVRTGMTLWTARQQCPELTILPPDFELYYDYSRRVREVYAGFTDRCEPFGMVKAMWSLSSRTFFAPGNADAISRLRSASVRS